MFCFVTVPIVHAQSADTGTTTPDQFFRATILKIDEEGSREVGGATEHYKVFEAVLTNGSDKGKQIQVTQSDLYASNQAIVVKQGDQVVVIQQEADGVMQYAITDAYRIPALWWSAALFFILAIVFGRLRGFTSILGLLASAAVIVWYVVPHIIAGADPVWTSLSASLLIATVSLFLAHGFNKRTAIAFAGTVVTLVISAFMAVEAVGFTHLFGTGNEESIFVLNALPGVSLKGILLGGIMLGLLGVLDDITTAQSAVVDELKQANPALTFRELYRRGLSVGREHIASLINTLFLAYAGAALPLFLLFSVNQGQALWTIFNNEMIAEEIVRTLVGSACLILAVPITTVFAAYAFRNHKVAEL